MDYRMTEAVHLPRTRWKSDQIPDLPCIRATKSVSADPDHTTTASPDDDWLPLFRAVIRALMPYPDAKRAVMDAARPFRVPGTEAETER